MASATQRVWLTRSAQGNRAWYPVVQSAGFQPVAFEALRFRVLHTELDEVREKLRGVDWVVFSSPRGVRSLAQLGLEPEKTARIACVGAATARVCAERYRPADFLPRGETAKDLAAGLIAQGDWSSAALVGAREARPELPQLLDGAGFEVRTCSVYATCLPTREESRLQWQPGDAVLLASPSSFEAIAQGGDLPRDLHLISIGPTTSQAIRAAGYSVAAESKSRNIQGLLAALRALELS